MSKKLLALIVAGLFLMPVFVLAGSYGVSFPSETWDSHIKVDDATSLDFGSGDFKVEVRFKTNNIASSQETLVAKMDSDANGWEIGASSPTPQRLWFWFYGSTGNGGCGKVDSGYADGEFHTIIADIESGLCSFYFDGELEATSSFAGFGSVDNNTAFTIGNSDEMYEWGYQFAGVIDYVKAWKGTDLVLDLSLEEGQGTSTNDASAYNNDGVLGGGAVWDFLGLIQIPGNAIGSITGTITGLVDGIGPFIWAFIGIPLGFVVVKRIIRILPG